MNPISLNSANGAALSQSRSTETATLRAPQPAAPEVSDKQPADRPDESNRAMRILRQEAVQSLVLRFRSSFGASFQASNAYTDPDSVDQTASDILKMARQAAQSESRSKSSVVVRIRKQLEEVISTTRAAVAGSEERNAVDDAARIVGKGLAALETAARARETVSETSIESRSRERSTIRIRTQEGDVVKFDLRRIDRLSANSRSIDTDQASLSATEVRVSSRSRLAFKVNGDLNAAELAAVQDVFSQAEQLAEEFFGGDLAAAFELATKLNFDNEQLARVNLRFRSAESTRVSASVLQNPVARALPEQNPESQGPAPTSRPVVDIAPPPAEGRVRRDSPASPAIPAAESPRVPDVEPKSEIRQTEQQPAAALPAALGSLFEFLNGVADYLTQLSERLLADSSALAESGGTRLQITRSVRLEILQAAFVQLVPNNLDGRLETAAELIDQVDAEVEREERSTDD